MDNCEAGTERQEKLVLKKGVYPVSFREKIRCIFRNQVRRFCCEEDGIGVVEIILILVVLIGLIIIFKSQLTTLVTNTFSNITNRAGTL